MTYEEAVREFQITHKQLYIDRVDYWTGQLAWSCYVDTLCKEGRITQKQYDRWSTPFRYGKHLVPKKWQLELALNERSYA